MILRYHKYVSHNYESYLHNLEKNGSTSNESKSYNSTSKSYDSNEQKSKRLNSGILEPLRSVVGRPKTIGQSILNFQLFWPVE